MWRRPKGNVATGNRKRNFCCRALVTPSASETCGVSPIYAIGMVEVGWNWVQNRKKNLNRQLNLKHTWGKKIVYHCECQKSNRIRLNARVVANLCFRCCPISIKLPVCARARTLKIVIGYFISANQSAVTPKCGRSKFRTNMHTHLVCSSLFLHNSQQQFSN